MKTLFLLLLFLSPGFLLAQKVIVLSVNQPPEFGFSVGKTDTIIVRNASIELGAGIDVYGGTGEYQYLWQPTENLSDSTLLHPLATPADTTSYILTVTDANGCSFSVNYVVNVREQAVGIPQKQVFSTLQTVLYPNPNDGTFHVKITGKPGSKVELFLYSESGSLLLQKTILRFSGELTEIFHLNSESGIYTLQIIAGTERISRQFIIH